VLGGFVPVPVATAPGYGSESSKTAVLRHAVQLLDQPLILTEQALQPEVQQYVQQAGLKSAAVAFESLLDFAPANKLDEADLEELALISFTSGSTGVPKGVMLKGRNLLVVAYGMATANRLEADSVSLNWMPLEHVASLVMFHLTQVYLGCQQIQVATERILQEPLSWLDLVNQYRVSHTWAPNFAYGLINERAADLAQQSWDLSCLRWMGNGAEAVVGKTTRRFLELLMPLGLGATVVSPGYGMSETGSGIVHSDRFSLHTSSDQEAFVEVGEPTAGVALRIVDDANQLVPEGVVGRLQVQGLTVMQGYYQRPDLNQQVFTTDGWFDTGDLGFLKAGRLTLTGRQKEQIVINGVNYYNHEIEAAIEQLEGIERSFTAACAVRRAEDATEQLVIFFVPAVQNGLQSQSNLVHLIKTMRRQVMQAIGMAPHVVLPVTPAEIPKTNLGKIQRSQLAQQFAAGEFDALIQRLHQHLATAPEPQNQIERQIAQIWQEVLRLSAVSIRDNFFELGGTSLLLMQVLQRLQQAGYQLSAVTLFQYPTIAALARHLQRAEQPSRLERPTQRRAAENSDIAVIGMSCRFPGANTIQQFWQNLCDGVESIRFFSDAEVLASGVDPELVRRADYVKASPILNCDITAFDAEFFGYSPREASLLDPQQRLLLECAWESLEDAGYDPLTYTGAIGLYAGASMNTYLLNQVYPNRHQLDENDSLRVLTLSSMGGFQMTTANDKDYLTTRISYKLNLTGPSVNVQTACSTSLVTVHLARQSLLNGECDMALAGGVSVHVPQKVGHLYQDGMILSPDGHCRAFDARAAGTIFGSGAGLVVLKRLDQAITDGDRIYAVIKGSAIGNDGSEKVGYFAPQSAGQARVTAEALAVGGVEPASIGYVEAHGTGTALGDPIELAGLTQAFGSDQPACPIGSVKTNVGHLNIASGIAGLIKTVLCLHHQTIPPSLHFETPNPQIDFANSRFYVNTQLQEWQSESSRRASVNSLGIGGTNAHIVLEEAPVLRADPDLRNSYIHKPTHYLFTLSAKSRRALRQLVKQYIEYLESQPDVALADVCFTASAGRAHFQHRLALVATSLAELRQSLTEWTVSNTVSNSDHVIPAQIATPSVAFMFTGQGSQYAGMGQELYHSSPVFRAAIDRCNAILQPDLGQSILTVIEQVDQLNQTRYTQPALFAIEYALAQLWMSWGVRPSAVIGHSIGEYVAACIAEVFSLEDALKLVAARGRLIQALPPGMMVAVMADLYTVKSLVANYEDEISIAAINGKENTVISGSTIAVQQAVADFQAQGYKTTALPVSHAFHSSLLTPILAEFAQIANQIEYNLPQIELISNLTGITATTTIATPEYWCDHLRQPVRFADGIATLHQAGYDLLIECGPKPTLLNLIEGMREAESKATFVLLPSLHPNQANWQTLCHSLAQLYIQNISIHWRSFYDLAKRISLPTYPFQRQRYWLDAPSLAPLTVTRSVHPLLGEKIRAPIQETLFQAQLSAATPSFLQDHRVQQRIVFPAAAFIEMALAAGKTVFKTTAVSLEQITIPRALILSDQCQTVQLIINKTNFQIYSLADADAEDWTLHCSGQIHARQTSSIELARSRDLSQLQQRFSSSQSASEHYQRCQSQGLEYGPRFQAVQRIWWRNGEALGQIQLENHDGDTALCLHPVLLDAAFQVISAALSDSVQSDTYLPVGLERLEWFNFTSTQIYWSYIRLNSCQGSQNSSRNQNGSRNGEHHLASFTADIELLDQSGTLVAKIEQLKLQRVERTAPAPSWRDWLYQVQWQPQPRLVQRSEGTGTWLILADRRGVAERLAAQLRLAKQPYQLVFLQQKNAPNPTEQTRLYLDAADPTAFEQLLVRLGQQTSLRGVIYLWSLDLVTEPELEQLLLEAVRPHCESLLYLMQALSNVVLPRLPHCWFVTAGAQRVGERAVVEPIQSWIWGMGRSFSLEHPEFSTKLIDLDLDALEQGALALAAEIQSAHALDLSEQIAFSGQNRYVARLGRFSPPEPAQPSLPTRLEIAQRGTLDNLTWHPVQRQLPAADQVEIRVRATGLNFRDLLNVLDLYPGEAGLLGLECAGEIVAVGSAVPDFAIGDAVIAIAPGSFGQYVTVSADLVARKPDNLDFAAAATVPIAFLTAYHTLLALAQLQAGERVLIHAAAGGVGQAAVQLAQQLGAEVWVTAAREKWQWLRDQGIQHIFNSRQPNFVDAVLHATDQQGVDVVLNSLAGEFVPHSLSVLRPGGRFIEIGKIGVWQSAQVAAVRSDVQYFLVDLIELTQQQPAQIQTMLHDLLAQFQTGTLQPLAKTLFPATQVAEAFRYMQQAKQIGKIVVTQPEVAPDLTCPSIHADGAYLITGGLGGLGLHMADWLLDQGATHVILVSRRASTAAEALIERYPDAEIEIVQADVAQPEQVAQLLQDFSAAGLRGIFHAAGTLADAAIEQQTWEQFATVMAAKVQGAWNLHCLTRDMALDCFVLFSSAASLLGSAGQVNYAAANAFLDALADYRQQLGLPGISINWGAWSQVGMAAERQLEAGLRTKGLGTIAPEQGLAAFAYLLKQPVSQVGVLPIDWSTWLPNSSFFAEFAPANSARSDAAKPQPSWLQGLTVSECRSRLTVYLSAQISKILGIDAATIDPQQGLSELGIDSLTSVELRNLLQTSLGCRLSATLLFDYPTIAALSDHLAASLSLSAAQEDSLQPEENPPSASPASIKIAELEQLSEAEAEALLLQELNQLTAD
jgi:myxalamid-type polyketide synthase MxaB